MGSMEASEKSPEMALFLEQVSGRSTALAANKCIPAPIGCGRQLDLSEIECWDRLTVTEYGISGLCATCQDEVFA